MVFPTHLRLKEAMIRRHSLFGRVIGRAELPSLLQLVSSAWDLPHGETFKVAYLIQGEEDVADKEAAMWSDVSDAFVLTFRTHRHDALYFPNSLLAEGRNVLLAAAAEEEFQRGYRYTYYVFMDGDASTSQPWVDAIPGFEHFLADWEPAVGLPSYGASAARLVEVTGGGEEPRALFHFDHIFVAVHAEATQVLLPYRTEFDAECAWVSQWIFTLLASALFMNHTLMLPSIEIQNPSHGEYPRDDCPLRFTNASQWLRRLAPQTAVHCFPDPASLGFQASTIFDMFPSSYLPWGHARRKRTLGSVEDYSKRSLAFLTSCQEPYLAAQRHAQPRISEFCPGCPANYAFYWLQLETAKRPLWGPNWHELGIMIWSTMGDIPVAAGCVAISRRLLELRNEGPNPHAALSAQLLQRELSKMGLGAVAVDTLAAPWVSHHGPQALDRIIRTALSSLHELDKSQPFMLSESRLQWLITILMGESRTVSPMPAFKAPLSAFS